VVKVLNLNFYCFSCVSGEELDIGITDKIKVENIEREESEVSSSTYETADEDFTESKKELEDFIRRSLEQAMSGRLSFKSLYLVMPLS
jgi:hypothetical protein